MRKSEQCVLYCKARELNQIVPPSAPSQLLGDKGVAVQGSPTLQKNCQLSQHMIVLANHRVEDEL